MTKTSLPLLVILGATATGKSELAFRLAKRIPCEIITADSAQVYRGLDIGTAKPSAAERAAVPHHLLDLIAADQRFNVAEFQQLADQAAEEIVRRGRLPILVGGTGLYVRAVVDRFHFEPLRPDPELRRKLTAQAGAQGSGALHARLATIDPAAARRIHRNDARRIIRALEVYELTGRRLTELQMEKRSESPYDPLLVVLECDRSRLYRRIGRRTDAQIAAGWVAEVRRLLANFAETAPGLQILGYRELVGYVKGERSLDETVYWIKRNTRRYARRQVTWLRKERAHVAFDVTGGITNALINNLAQRVAGKVSRL